MHDELVKRLREPCQYENCILCQQAADAIEELSKPRWIPVTERLPEDEKTVLTWGKENKCILLDWMHDNKWCCFGDADYWMPLPPPPKEVEP